MATYPAKPWTNGQQYEIVPGETFEYDAVNATWVHLTKATLDSDFQVDKAALLAADSALDTRLTTAEGSISTLQSDVTTLQGNISTLTGMSDSETARIQQNIADINNAYAMLDSDGLNIQALRTDLNAEIAATNSEVSSLQSDMATAQSDITSNTNAINALAIPVISATQPVGATGQLWINTNDGKLYYWNDSDAFVSIVTV